MCLLRWELIKENKKVRKKKEKPLSTKKTIKTARKYFLFFFIVAFLVESVCSFFFLTFIGIFFLGRFLGRERVFFLCSFCLNRFLCLKRAFLVESVPSALLFSFIKSISSESWNQKWGQELLQEPSGKGNLHGGEKHILKRKKKYFYSILKYEFRKLSHTESSSTHRLPTI